MTLVFARIRIISGKEEVIIDELRAISGIREVSAFQERSRFGLFISIPPADLSSLRNRLDSIKDIKIDDFIVQPDIPKGLPFGNALERTIVQLGQVASALGSSPRVAAKKSRLELSEARISSIRKELLTFRFDWIAEKLESRRLLNWILADTPKERAELSEAIALVFESVSKAYSESDSSNPVSEIGQEFGALSNKRHDEYTIQFTNLVSELRDLVEVRRIYVEAAAEGGFERTYLAELAAD